jgi:hypothetical protein
MISNVHHIKSPITIIQTKLSIPPKYKKQCIEEVYRLGDSMNQKTNVKAIRSSFSIWNETKTFSLLLNKIIETIYINFPIKDDRWEYTFIDTWSIIYKKGHYAVPHDHMPNHISYVYYLQSSGNTPLIFDECNFKINPVDDMLVIFPSYLIHSVPEHQYEEDRICIAGNLDLFPNK